MKLLAILGNITFTVIGLIAIALALTSPMLFDSPGSEHNTYLWGVFWSIVALPFSSLICAIISWVLTVKYQYYKKSLLILLIPVINLAIFVAFIAYIQLNCQGSFSCVH